MNQLESPYTASVSTKNNIARLSHGYHLSQQKEFRSLNNTIWKNKDGKAVGEVRATGDSKGKTAGNFTWLRVYDAGHMVPHDQPEVALEFFTRQVLACSHISLVTKP